MKLQAILYFVFIQLSIAFVIDYNDQNEHQEASYFTLKTKNGKEVTGNMAEFNEILREKNSELEALPEYEQILHDGYGSLNTEMERLIEEGRKEEVLMLTSNAIADMYEEMFRAAGMELTIHNRKPYIFMP